MSPVRISGYRLNLHNLARQRVGHISRAGRCFREAVTAMADADDL
jgi:hypothetical protein